MKTAHVMHVNHVRAELFCRLVAMQDWISIKNNQISLKHIPGVSLLGLQQLVELEATLAEGLVTPTTGYQSTFDL
jgi:hypothetical protein